MKKKRLREGQTWFFIKPSGLTTHLTLTNYQLVDYRFTQALRFKSKKKLKRVVELIELGRYNYPKYINIH